MADAVNSLGLSAIRKIVFSQTHVVQTDALVEGALVAFRRSGDDADVVVAATGSLYLCGFICDQQPSGGTSAGQVVNVQYQGLALGILKSATTVTAGDVLQGAGTLNIGDLMTWTGASDVYVIGQAMETKTAGAGTNDPVLVRMTGPYRKT